MYKPQLFALITWLIAVQLCAQNNNTPIFTGCGADVLHKMHPDFQERQNKIDQQAAADAAHPPVQGRLFQTVRTLPVVVHIIHDGGPENISDVQVQQGIAQLNAAFNATYGNSINTDIQFCLAQRDPNGLATTGITRNQSPLTSFDMDSQDLALKDVNRWMPTCYVNIWVVAAINSSSSGNGVIGYAYFPSAHGSNRDGIVMEASYLGSSPANTSVLVHEMGHYLGLYHTFQGGCPNNNCLLDGDRVCDTPPDQTTFSSCNPNANSCGTDADDSSANNPFTVDVADLGEDYMDYSSLQCFSTFTQGQSDRMNWHITHIRSSLLGCLSCQSPCPAPLTAAITSPAAPQTIPVGSTINFTATTSNTTSYAWNIDNDPAFALGLNASYTFNTVGMFWVKFRAISGNPEYCADAIDSIQVTVLCDAQAVFSVPPLVQNGLPVTFTNSSVNASTYEWVLDNVIISNSANLDYTFINTGVYQLCLRAGNANCVSILCATVYVQQPGGQAGCDNTFIKSLPNMGGDYPNIFPHPSGDFFATGTRNDSMVLVRFDQGGTALWTRTFRFGTERMAIRDLFVDASGDVIGVAHRVNLALGSLKSTAFRYNLTSHSFVWIKDLTGSVYTQIHAQDANNILLTGESDASSTQFIRLNKNTGLPGGYNLQGEQGDFYSSLHNNTLYGACRRYVGGDDFRAAIFAHNATTGDFQWQNLVVTTGNGPTRMYPERPVVDADNLVVIASGDLSGFNVYLDGAVEQVAIKTNLSGNVQWTKQYVFTGYNRPVAKAVVATATGYYMVGNLYDPNQGNFGYGTVISTDKQGNVVWAKRLGISGRNIVRNIMERNGFLYLTMSSDSYSNNDLLLVKLDQQGNTNTTCEFVQPIQVSVINLTNVQQPRNYGVITSGPTPVTVTTSTNTTDFQTVTYCNTPCECTALTISAGSDTSICQGQSVILQATPGFEAYSWSPATGLDDPNSPNPVASPVATTTYTLDAVSYGAELVGNGDFSLGNTGFTSGYISGGIGFGTYNVTPNPQLFNNQWIIPNDHSPNFDNLMMMIDGDNNGNFPPIWQQSVAVQPNTDYRFQFWGAMAYFSSPPVIELKINGSVRGIFTLQGGNAVVGIWQEFNLLINSGVASQLNLVLTDKNTASIGNDFALDDISLRQVCHYSDEVTIQVRNNTGQILDLGPDISTCANAVYTFDAGPGFEQYRWQDGSTERAFTAFNPGTYWVLVRDSCGGEQTDTVNVLLTPAPTLDAGADKFICAGNNTTLDFTSNGVFTSFNWTPTTGLSCNLCANPVASPAVSTTYYLAASTADGCTSLDSITVWVNPPASSNLNIIRCQNDPYVFNGITFSTDTSFTSIYSTINGCDSLVNTQVSFLPLPTRAATISFCSGASVSIGGQVYAEAGTVTDTLPGGIGCDTVVTYTLIKLPLISISVTVEFCAGETISIGGQGYTEAGTVVDTIPGGVGCDTVVTYTLIKLPLNSRAETIEFCPGETVVVGGQSYTLPGTVVQTVASNTGGCDTIVTYTLQYLTPAPSTVNIKCPLNIGVAVLPGTFSTVVNYPLPTATTDCPCPGITMNLTAGLPSGSGFPNGLTTVCYTAVDQCGNTASCCFQVFIREEQACDVKVIGCIKYELLNITADAGQNYTYRIRVTNNCSNKLIYTAIQVPSGVVAMEPLGFSLFEAESGRKYTVTSPNYTPFYSIRFRSTADSIANGQSEIFRYTLPAQAVPTYIHITSRLAPQVFYEAHLNTFYCPIGVTPDKPGERTDASSWVPDKELRLFPNPTAHELFVDLADWSEEKVQLRVWDAYARLVHETTVEAGAAPLLLSLPGQLSSGCYLLELTGSKGEKQSRRFVVQR